jgi:ribosome recycling factor
LKTLENKMKVSAEHFRWDLSKLRTGRASISLFEDIKVEYYGLLTPINQLASLAIPDPTLITVTPWDPTLLEAIDKAIRAADLGLNPISDGKTLKVPVPPLDDERRREMARSEMLEKTALQNMRAGRDRSAARKTRRSPNEKFSGLGCSEAHRRLQQEDRGHGRRQENLRTLTTPRPGGIPDRIAPSPRTPGTVRGSPVAKQAPSLRGSSGRHHPGLPSLLGGRGRRRTTRLNGAVVY